MRTLPWPSRFDAAYCWGNSFAYFDHDDCCRFLEAVAGRSSRAAIDPRKWGGRRIDPASPAARAETPSRRSRSSQPEHLQRHREPDGYHVHLYRWRPAGGKPIHQWVHSGGRDSTDAAGAGMKLSNRLRRRRRHTLCASLAAPHRRGDCGPPKANHERASQSAGYCRPARHLTRPLRAGRAAHRVATAARYDRRSGCARLSGTPRASCGSDREWHPIQRFAQKRPRYAGR